MIDRSEKDIIKNWKEKDAIKVSCCCITYNHENYIADALDSMLMQETDFPFEIIVRDDCSTDNTANTIRRYAKEFPTIIKPILEKENQYSKGIRPTRPAFKMAKGKYLAILEGDDYWTDPLKLQKQVDILEDNPDISLVFNNALIHIYNKEGKIISKKLHTEDLKSGYVTIAQVLKSKIVPTGSVVFKNVDVHKFLKDNFPVGDTPTFMYLGKFGKLYYDDAVTSVYRLLPTGMVKSQLSTIKKNIEFIAYYKTLQEEFSEFELDDLINKLIPKRYEKIIKLSIKQRKILIALKYVFILLKTNPNHLMDMIKKEIKR